MAGTGGQGNARLGAPGGPGGDVLVLADAAVRTLKHIQDAKRYHAKSGEPGSRSSAQRKGEGKAPCFLCAAGMLRACCPFPALDATDEIIKVPAGTIVYLESGQPLVDLSKHGDSIVVARYTPQPSSVGAPQPTALRQRFASQP